MSPALEKLFRLMRFNFAAEDCSRLTHGRRGRLAWDVSAARKEKQYRDSLPKFDGGMFGAMQLFAHMMDRSEA